MTDAGIMETLVEQCPSWGYVFLLAIALLASMRIADMGLRMCSALVSRVRR